MFRKNIIKLSTTEYNLYLCKSCYCDRLSVSNKVVQKRFLLCFAKIWVSRRIQPLNFSVNSTELKWDASARRIWPDFRM